MHSKVKFLTAIWGDVYIERFCALSLPSFLAPGNLPALAQLTDMEVVIMTRKSDFREFKKHPAFERLSNICSVRFVAIDDLIAKSVYGVTLTLAYARAIIACGNDMLHTYFVFMNADFVLANGSLQSLYKHIQSGRSIVLGPSFRAIAEDVEPQLKDAVDKDLSVLNLPTRQMVEMSLPHPHRTTIAKTKNQQLYYSTHPNQLFWQVDEHTMLGRYYLIFMLCLKPERIITSINCYCDYSFIPELCPSGDEVVMSDSDNFFMLELQDRDQELHLLRFGEQSDRKVARSLQEWTTFEHRRAASYDIVFHSRDIPPEIEATKAKATAYIDSISNKLGSPKPHVNHKYWRYGVEAWQEQRMAMGLTASPPELAPNVLDALMLFRRLWLWVSRNTVQYLMNSFRPLRGYSRPLRRFRPMLAGFGNWLNLKWMIAKDSANHLIIDALAEVSSTNGPVLVVMDTNKHNPDSLQAHQANVQTVDLCEIEQNEVGLSSHIPDNEYSHILLDLRTISDFKRMQGILEDGVSVMAQNGTLHVFLLPFCHETNEFVFSNTLFDLQELFANRVQTFTVRSANGGRGCRFCHTIKNRYIYSGKSALFWIIPAVLIVLPFLLVSDLFLRLKPSLKGYVRGSSSYAVRVQFL